MKKFKKLLEKKWFAYTFALVVAVLVFLFFFNIGFFIGVLGTLILMLRPVIGGLIFAYLLNPVMVFFEDKVLKGIKKYLPRHILALVITLLCFVLAFVFLGIVIVPAVVDSIVSIVSSIPAYQAEVMSLVDNVLTALKENGIEIGFESTFSQLIPRVTAFITEHLDTLITHSIGFGTTVVNILIGFVIMLYLLAGKKRLLSGLDRLRRSWLRPEKYESHTLFFKRCHRIIIRFVGCDLLDGLIIGVINSIFMLIAGMPHVALVSVIIGVTNLVPTFGPLVGAIIGALILVFSSPFQALIFLIFSIALQTVDGYIIKPKLFGDVLGVPPVFVLVGIVLGGAMFGVIGILVAVPLTAILTFIYEDYFIPFLKRKRDKKIKEVEEEKKEEAKD